MLNTMNMKVDSFLTPALCHAYVYMSPPFLSTKGFLTFRFNAPFSHTSFSLLHFFQ